MCGVNQRSNKKKKRRGDHEVDRTSIGETFQRWNYPRKEVTQGEEQEEGKGRAKKSTVKNRRQERESTSYQVVSCFSFLYLSFLVLFFSLSFKLYSRSQVSPFYPFFTNDRERRALALIWVELSRSTSEKKDRIHDGEEFERSSLVISLIISDVDRSRVRFRPMEANGQRAGE